MCKSIRRRVSDKEDSGKQRLMEKAVSALCNQAGFH